MALTAPQSFLAYIAGQYQVIVAAVVGGVGSAFQIPALNGAGQLDITMMPPGLDTLPQQMAALVAGTADYSNPYQSGQPWLELGEF